MEARAGNSILDFETLFSDCKELLNGRGPSDVRKKERCGPSAIQNKTKQNKTKAVIERNSFSKVTYCLLGLVSTTIQASPQICRLFLRNFGSDVESLSITQTHQSID